MVSKCELVIGFLIGCGVVAKCELGTKLHFVLLSNYHATGVFHYYFENVPRLKLQRESIISRLGY
jgi:hypothetical protein